MRAAVLEGKQDLVVKNVPEPMITRVTDVKVRIKATAVCGSDPSIFRGYQRANYPVILGHETAGEVVQVGSGCDKSTIKLGDSVVVYPVFSCGKCSFCKSGNFNLCMAGGVIGRDRDGAFAEYMVVDETRLFTFPKSSTYLEATGIGALAPVHASHRRLDIRPGKTVVVLGVGVSALMHTQLAKISGAKVIGIGRTAWKLDLAKALGTDVVINAREEDAVQAVLDLTGGIGADIVIETAGSSDTVKDSVKMSAPGGVIMVYSLPKQPTEFDFQDLYRKHLTILGSRMFLPVDYLTSISLLAEGKIKVKPVITHTYGLEQIMDAILLADDPAVKSMRAVVEI